MYVKKNDINNISFDRKKYDFVTIGRLAKEKGILEISEVFSHTNHSLLVAGIADESFDIDELLDIVSCNDNINLLLEYLSEDDFTSCINQSRYCILNYQGVYSERSSGIALDALFSGIPVVGHRCRALQFIEDYGMGFLYDDAEKFDFSSILTKSVWEKCVSAIDVYKQEFEKHKQNLLDFVGVA